MGESLLAIGAGFPSHRAVAIGNRKSSLLARRAMVAGARRFPEPPMPRSRRKPRRAASRPPPMGDGIERLGPEGGVARAFATGGEEGTFG